MKKGLNSYTIKYWMEKIGIIQLLINSFACQSQVPVKKVGKK